MRAHWNREQTIAQLQSWLSTHNLTILYPLATPITEECGYVDLPDIPMNVTVNIPELADTKVLVHRIR